MPLDASAAWVDRQGVRKRLTLGDVLAVAPYNAHVATLRARLPDGARVGTVDKFQGQEAPIVPFSMATSTADEAPRDTEFLYSLKPPQRRTSRARCVAAIIASPALLTPPCRTRSRCAWPSGAGVGHLAAGAVGARRPPRRRTAA